MNIFVAGIHGVGKTYLAKRLSDENKLMHTSASKLIQEERASEDWNIDKRVADMDANQVALANAVAKKNSENIALLLDGHFVLLGQDGQFRPLDVSVFKTLNLSSVILIEAQPDVVASRVTQRENIYRDPTWLSDFIRRERAQAERVCGELKLPLTILDSPSDVEFAKAVGKHQS